MSCLHNNNCRRRQAWLALLLCLPLTIASGAAYAETCVQPAGREADLIYNSDYHAYQFCNGVHWVLVGPIAVRPLVTPTAADGYFVMSKSMWNANLQAASGVSTSGAAAANALCLTDLTTNTGWRGYADANARGILTSGKVRAFICDQYVGCNQLNANTTYYFADANDTTHGGESFTTDGSGLGPNYQRDWSLSNYFGSAYRYWVGGSDAGYAGSNTQWGYGLWAAGVHCGTGFGSWNSSSSGMSGCAGVAGAMGRGGNGAYTAEYGGYAACVDGTGGDTCNQSDHLVCFVNP